MNKNKINYDKHDVVFASDMNFWKHVLKRTNQAVIVLNDKRLPKKTLKKIGGTGIGYEKIYIIAYPSLLDPSKILYKNIIFDENSSGALDGFKHFVDSSVLDVEEYLASIKKSYNHYNYLPKNAKIKEIIVGDNDKFPVREPKSFTSTENTMFYRPEIKKNFDDKDEKEKKTETEYEKKSQINEETNKEFKPNIGTIAVKNLSNSDKIESEKESEKGDENEKTESITESPQSTSTGITQPISPLSTPISASTDLLTNNNKKDEKDEKDEKYEKDEKDDEYIKDSNGKICKRKNIDPKIGHCNMIKDSKGNVCNKKDINTKTNICNKDKQLMQSNDGKLCSKKDFDNNKKICKKIIEEPKTKSCKNVDTKTGKCLDTKVVKEKPKFKPLENDKEGKTQLIDKKGNKIIKNKEGKVVEVRDKQGKIIQTNLEKRKQIRELENKKKQEDEKHKQELENKKKQEQEKQKQNKKRTMPDYYKKTSKKKLKGGKRKTKKINSQI